MTSITPHMLSRRRGGHRLQWLVGRRLPFAPFARRECQGCVAYSVEEGDYGGAGGCSIEVGSSKYAGVDRAWGRRGA